MATNGVLSNEYNVDVTSSASTRAIDVTWSDYLGEFAFVYAQNNLGLRLRLMEWGNSSSVNPTSDASITIKSHTTLGDFQEASLVYDSLRNRYVSFYTFQTSMRANVCTSTGCLLYTSPSPRD